jgi:predicted nucleic acid-binding protein
LSEKPNLIFDSCCLINLCAVGTLNDWLKPLGYDWHIPSLVKKESFYVFDYDESGKRIKSKLELDEDFNSGFLKDCQFASQSELDTFFRLLSILDDGEAMALAIASHRKWTCATDDKKARICALELGIATKTTPELLWDWSVQTSAKPEVISKYLLRIQDKAKFYPNSDFPFFHWWQKQID